MVIKWALVDLCATFGAWIVHLQYRHSLSDSGAYDAFLNLLQALQNLGLIPRQWDLIVQVLKYFKNWIWYIFQFYPLQNLLRILENIKTFSDSFGLLLESSNFRDFFSLWHKIWTWISKLKIKRKTSRTVIELVRIKRTE